MEKAVQKFKTFNPENENCPVCAVFNSIYRSNSLQKELEIPAEIGKGYCRRIIVKPSMDINISDITFYEKTMLGGKQDNSFYCLAFCLGEPLRWRVEGDKKEHAIASGENYIFNGNQGNSICCYNPGQHFLGVSIQLDPKIIADFIRQLGKVYSLSGIPYGNSFVYKGKFSAGIKLLLNEIINCRYRDNIKRIYLEGKILELVAVYMNELIFENGAGYFPARLSSSDVNSLQKAKRLLDENIPSPPTIDKLARLVCLNEYKLKTGFKELFGMPVHAYVIDKRLEMARFLLEGKKLRVTEAALLVGYNDASHFAEKFRRKYGINPSEYTKNMEVEIGEGHLPHPCGDCREDGL